MSLDAEASLRSGRRTSCRRRRACRAPPASRAWSSASATAGAAPGVVCTTTSAPLSSDRAHERVAGPASRPGDSGLPSAGQLVRRVPPLGPRTRAGRRDGRDRAESVAWVTSKPWSASIDLEIFLGGHGARADELANGLAPRLGGLFLARPQSAVISVPTPRSVKSSAMTLWAVRPSRTWTRSTPACERAGGWLGLDLHAARDGALGELLLEVLGASAR